MLWWQQTILDLEKCFQTQVAVSFSQGKIKVKCIIQFGIPPHVKQILIYDINNKPFTFKFDETTSSQVKKQDDAYIQFYLKEYDEIVNCYCESILLYLWKVNWELQWIYW